MMSLREGSAAATKEITVLVKLHLLEPKLLNRVHKTLTGSAPIVAVVVVVVIVVVLVPVVAGVVVAITVTGLGGIRSRDRGDKSLALGDGSRVLVLVVVRSIQLLRVAIELLMYVRRCRGRPDMGRRQRDIPEGKIGRLALLP